jgi:hypothetical protein
MKKGKIIVLCLMLILSLMFSVYGCKKKDQPTETTQETTTTTEAITTQIAEKTEEIKQVTETLKADVNTSISEIKAELDKLSVDQLRQTALQYQQLIQAKSAEVETVTAKIKNMSITQAMGDEMKTLQTDIDGLNTSLKALKDRFQLYYDKLKEKGGDLSGFAL